MSDISKELSLLLAIKKSRADFYRAVFNHATRWRSENGFEELSRDQRNLLRNEGIAQIAEFFFVVREAGLTKADALRGFLERHNEDMRSLLASCHRGYTEDGLSKARIERAIFSERQIEYVLHECSSGDLRFDQISLCRVFTQLMSPESCRKLIILLSETGFINRQEYNQVLISSIGIMEDLYRDLLVKTGENFK